MFAMRKTRSQTQAENATNTRGTASVDAAPDDNLADREQRITDLMELVGMIRTLPVVDLHNILTFLNVSFPGRKFELQCHIISFLESNFDRLSPKIKEVYSLSVAKQNAMQTPIVQQNPATAAAAPTAAAAAAAPRARRMTRDSGITGVAGGQRANVLPIHPTAATAAPTAAAAAAPRARRMRRGGGITGVAGDQRANVLPIHPTAAAAAAPRARRMTRGRGITRVAGGQRANVLPMHPTAATAAPTAAAAAPRARRMTRGGRITRVAGGQRANVLPMHPTAATAAPTAAAAAPRARRMTRGRGITRVAGGQRANVLPMHPTAAPTAAVAPRARQMTRGGGIMGVAGGQRANVLTINPSAATAAPTAAATAAPTAAAAAAPRAGQMTGGGGITGVAGGQRANVLPIHPDVRLKKLSFYEVLDTLIKPSSLVPHPTAHFLHDRRFYFSLTPEQATMIASSRDIRKDKVKFPIQVQLRFCLLETSCEQEDCFPNHLLVQVNNKNCELPSVIPTNGPFGPPKRPPCPLNITINVMLSSIVTNTITVEWGHDLRRHFCVAVYLVKKLTSAQLLQSMKVRGAKPAEYTRGLIKEKLAEDSDCEIATTMLTVSLKCPLGKVKMVLPCRASTCSHLQCFDANLYLKMNERKATWNCPVCDKPAIYEHLVIDGYFMKVLQSALLRSDDTEIQLHKDGSWSTPNLRIESQLVDTPSRDRQQIQVSEIVDLTLSDTAGDLPLAKRQRK